MLFDLPLQRSILFPYRFCPDRPTAQEHHVVEFVLVVLMRGLSPVSEAFAVPAPHALGATLAFGELTKAGLPGLAAVAMLVRYLLSK